MGGGDGVQRWPSYFFCCMSPPCVPVHEEYSRIDEKSHRRRKLRKLLERIVKEGKSIYGPAAKPLSFQYDAVSYSQNFDDGCHRDDEYVIRPLPTGVSRF